jgi:outer membrane protein OmpA-like peptidoglycan-associated protein
VIFAATAGLRFRFLDTARGDGYVVPRAGYLLDRNDNSSYATAHLEAGAEFTVDGPVRLGPYVQIAGAFGPSNFVYFVVGINLSAVVVRRAPPRAKPKPQTLWTPREDDEGDDRFVDERPPPPSPPPVDEAPAPAVLAPQMVLEGVTFALDSAEIQPASEAALARAAQLLRDNPSARVEIAGHTCDLGSDDYNLKLSQARATAVADWLVAHGIDRSRFEVRGYGNTQPKVANDSEANRALNRRIEFRRLDQ